MKRIWVDREKCLGCKSCELQCAIERDSVSKTLLDAMREDPKPMARVAVAGVTGRSLPLQCRHCQDAPCMKACPSGALQRKEQTEVIVLNQAKCRGCWMCVMSCPFGAVLPSDSYKVAVKCDACIHMEEQACVNACPTGALTLETAGEFDKVLVRKRRQLALFAFEDGDGSKVSLELAGKDDTI